jgi:hypothetical protein
MRQPDLLPLQRSMGTNSVLPLGPRDLGPRRISISKIQENVRACEA